ncbi:MAG: type II toxin-antitoxin system Phd/YefM family antitoxin [Reyranellaceae bacterium]
MGTISYSKLRQNLATVMDQVYDDKLPMVVERRNAKSVVLVPLDEYESWQETLHLIRTPANAKRLRQGLAEARAGRLVERTLLEPKQVAKRKAKR